MFGGFTPTVGQTFTLISADTVSGSFSQINGPGGITWDSETTSNSFSITAIPEPGTTVLLLFAAAVLFPLIRKMRR